MEKYKVTGSGDRLSVINSRKVFANCFTKANAERICLCVNGWDALEKQRDALLKVAKKANDRLEYAMSQDDSVELQETLEKAIALCEK